MAPIYHHVTHYLINSPITFASQLQCRPPCAPAVLPCLRVGRRRRRTGYSGLSFGGGRLYLSNSAAIYNYPYHRSTSVFSILDIECSSPLGSRT